MTRNTDEFVLTASNQIFKDLRSRRPRIRMRRRAAGLETCFGRSRPQKDNRNRKCRNFKKSLAGRPYSAPRGGPRGVLLPFLKRGSQIRCITFAPASQPPQRRTARAILKFGDLPRIPEAPPRRKTPAKKSRPNPDNAKILNEIFRREKPRYWESGAGRRVRDSVNRL